MGCWAASLHRDLHCESPKPAALLDSLPLNCFADLSFQLAADTLR